MCILKKFKFLIVFIVIFYSLPLFSEDNNTCFIISKKIRPYIEMLNGFSEVSKNKSELFDLSKEKIDRNDLVKCSFLISSGTNANNFLKNIKNNSKKIYTFFIYKNESSKYFTDNSSFGIYLYPEPENLLKYYLKNGINNIFVLYSENKVEQYLVNAKNFFINYNINLFYKKINDFKQFDKIILKQKISNLWILPDQLYSSKNILDYIISKSAIYNINIIGFNRYFYELGAKYSIIVNYKAIGKIIYNILSEKFNTKHLINSPFDFKVAKEE